MPEISVRAAAASAGAAAGAVTGAVTAQAAAVDAPLPYGLFCAAVAAASAVWLAPFIAGNRPWATLGLGAAIYGLGVLAFPVASLVLGLEVPRDGRIETLGDVPRAYVMAPIGVLFAAPFVPAVALTTLAVTFVIDVVRPGADEMRRTVVERAAIEDAAQAMTALPDEPAAAGADESAAWTARSGDVLSDAPDAQRGATPDGVFGHAALVGAGCLVALGVAGYLWLVWAARNWGY